MKILDTHNERGVEERRFVLQVEDRSVPGVLWTPSESDAPLPLVLIGHGGTQHKLDATILARGRRLVRHHGIAAVAIDAVGHGDRVPPEQRPEPGVLRGRPRWGRDAFDHMVADWHATLDAVQGLHDVGRGPVGYWGVSMGTVFGIPFIAREPRVQVAVLGLCGSMVERTFADAPKVSCPVQFRWQLEDELMSRESVLELFDALGSSDKKLHGFPGKHIFTPQAESLVENSFLAQHLGAGAR